MKHFEFVNQSQPVIFAPQTSKHKHPCGVAGLETDRMVFFCQLLYKSAVVFVDLLHIFTAHSGGNPKHTIVKDVTWPSCQRLFEQQGNI